MTETKKVPEKKEKDMTDLEYLAWSLSFLEREHQASLERVRSLTAQIEGLREDMKAVKVDQLQKACGQIHNNFTMQKKQLLARIKQIRVDIKHVKSIYRKLKVVEG